MRFYFAWIIYFSLLCAGQPVLAGAPVFHVAAYNVENYLDAPSGTRPVKSPQARAKVCESILAIKPDVLALEEIGSSNVLFNLQAELKKQGLDLPEWEYVTGYDTNIHVCVLSRFPIVRRRSHTNETFLLEGRRMHTSRGFADLEIQVTPQFKFTLIAAHLKSMRPSPIADEGEWRYEEAAALRSIIDSHFQQNPEENIVVLGDLNDLKDSKPVRALMGRGKKRLFDTRPAERNGDKPGGETASHAARTVTWTHFYAKEDVYSRIDYILISHAMKNEWLPTETYILSLPNWGVASDHRPVVAGFTEENLKP